jgi:hypothetical protein
MPTSDANGSIDRIVLIAGGCTVAAMTRVIAIACLAAMTLCAPANGAAFDLDKITGLYVQGFMNGNVEGGKYWSDDALEIVKLSPNTAYFHTHLEFYNGHLCSIWGVAAVEGQSLVYRNPDTQCVLRLDVAGGKITFADEEGRCRVGTCGNRGMYDRESFRLASRRPIRYMRQLLASTQYTDALKEYHAHRPE